MQHIDSQTTSSKFELSTHVKYFECCISCESYEEDIEFIFQSKTGSQWKPDILRGCFFLPLI